MAYKPYSLITLVATEDILNSLKNTETDWRLAIAGQAFIVDKTNYIANNGYITITVYLNR